MKQRVLIVDDSLTVRMDLAEAFASAGFEAVPCRDAASARHALEGANVDAVVLDVRLPDADGVDLVAEFRERLGVRVPILLLSDEAEVADRLRGLGVGADEYVGKPYDARELVTRTRLRLNPTGADSHEMPILIVDDSATLRAELQRVLQSHGFRTLSAESGEVALRMLATVRPAVIIVDRVMPGLDGASFIRRIRLDSALRRVPCILLTADQGEQAELGALDSGADAFVHKSDDLRVLVARVKALLRTGAPPAETESVAESLLTPKRILTVDDSRTYAERLAEVLREERYEVVLASRGEEALELLSAQAVDCILLDLVMPGLGGQETCRRLKASPSTRDIPVIVLTAVEDRQAMLDGLAMGADDFIQKSSEFEVLKARVRAQLRRRQFEEETRRVRERLLQNELQAAEARAAQQLAETRAALVDELERRNAELQRAAQTQERLVHQFRTANEALERAYVELQSTQAQLIQSAKMASLGELVAGVAHEINNPLAFVINHVDTVRRCLKKMNGVNADQASVAANARQRAEERLQEIDGGLERIRELVVKLRTFSRIDEGERGDVDLSELVDSLLTILRYRTKRLSVTTDLQGPARLDCYPGLLNQALMNLLANAIDASPDGGTITLATRKQNGFCQFLIRDGGAGIPDHVKPRVMEPFFTTKPVGQGTGLGLSITYSIIRKHGGELELRDAQPSGTEAVLSLPLNPQK